MQAIAHLIGLHPNQAGPYRVEIAPKAQGAAPGITAQGLTEVGIPALGKGGAAGQAIFMKQTLALMHGHGGGLPQGPGEPVFAAAGQTLLIAGVTPFVGGGQEGGKGLPRHQASGDPEIAGAQCGGKGMGGEGAGAALAVVTPAIQQFATETLLALISQVPGLAGPRGDRACPIQQLRQPLAEGGK